MNNDAAVEQIAQATLSVLRPLTSLSNEKMVRANFQPTDKYADSFVRAFRKGTGILRLGAPDSNAPINSLDIFIALKPGPASGEWVGYSIDIKKPENDPRISLFRKWPESGGEEDADLNKFPELVPHILELLSGPLTPGNVEPAQQSPDTMY